MVLFERGWQSVIPNFQAATIKTTWIDPDPDPDTFGCLEKSDSPMRNRM